MINQITLIGRVVEKPIIRKFDDGFSAATLNLAVTRPFKNMEGNYDCDFIKVSLWNGVAQSASDYCDMGDIVGVKGRIVNKDSEVKFEIDNKTLSKKIYALEIIGERVVFISTSRKKNEEVFVASNEGE